MLPVDGVVDPPAALLDADAAPLALSKKAAARERLSELLRQDDVSGTKKHVGQNTVGAIAIDVSRQPTCTRGCRPRTSQSTQCGWLRRGQQGQARVRLGRHRWWQYAGRGAGRAAQAS